MNSTQVTAEQLEYMAYIRRQLHKIPEEGNKEYRTRSVIINELKAANADIISDIASTGIKAVFYGRDRENAIAFRAELDALAIAETICAQYKSQNPGFAHACGHDAHMAMLLGLAKILGASKASLEKSVVLLFEPDEECFGGAARMIAEGALNNPAVQEVYAMHLMPELEKGKIGIKPGYLMAQSTEFKITVLGKAAHGATPEKGI
ncbi:MAG TPA: amidohydrolase, partial [Clostridia bacterium]|nr:amidohydrolase [Clostridia bacterium]